MTVPYIDLNTDKFTCSQKHQECVPNKLSAIIRIKYIIFFTFSFHVLIIIIIIIIIIIARKDEMKSFLPGSDDLF